MLESHELYNSLPDAGEPSPDESNGSEDPHNPPSTLYETKQVKHKQEKVNSNSLQPLHLNVKIADLYKYTKDLKAYKDIEFEQFKTFEYRLSNVIQKLSLASEQSFHWGDLKNGNRNLTKQSEEILLLVLNDALAGIPAEDTQSLRETTDWKGRFLRIFRRLQSSFPEDAGTIYQRDLQNIKMSPGEAIVAYNKRYQHAYQRAKRHNRVLHGVGAIELYLSSLPAQHDIIRSIQLNLAPQITKLSLEEAMHQVAVSILRVKPDGKISRPAVFAAFDNQPKQQHKKENYLRQQHSRKGTREKGRYHMNKKECSRCGLWTSHRPDQCIARGKRCNQCGKLGHFARTCRSKPELSSTRAVASLVLSPDSEAHGMEPKPAGVPEDDDINSFDKPEVMGFEPTTSSGETEIKQTATEVDGIEPKTSSV